MTHLRITNSLNNILGIGDVQERSYFALWNETGSLDTIQWKQDEEYMFIDGLSNYDNLTEDSEPNAIYSKDFWIAKTVADRSFEYDTAKFKGCVGEAVKIETFYLCSSTCT